MVFKKENKLLTMDKMDIFKFIDCLCTRKQLPYVRLITVYLKDGAVTNVCLCRYTDKNIAKKAAKVGLNEDRLMTLYGAGIKIANFNGYDIQKGDYYLNYNVLKKDLTIYRT